MPPDGITETSCFPGSDERWSMSAAIVDAEIPMAALLVSHLGCSKFSRLSTRSLIACSSAWKYALSERFPLLQKPQLSRLWQATNVRRLCFERCLPAVSLPQCLCYLPNLRQGLAFQNLVRASKKINASDYFMPVIYNSMTADW